MRLSSLAILASTLLASGIAWAQGPQEVKRTPVGDGSSLSHVAPTPEMWFYDQELRQRYSPELAVRRKAELETAQRMQRMAASEWYGHSAARPNANPTPFTGGVYSPTWSSTTRDPYRWAGYQSGATIVLPSARPVYNVW